MSLADAAELLSLHGRVRPQGTAEWLGPFELPSCVASFYAEVGPDDVVIENYGSPFHLPRLAALWALQAGYRWNARTGVAVPSWDDDWLVVAQMDGDPFIALRSTGTVLHAQHGVGTWAPEEMFPDLASMAVAMGWLGYVAAGAGRDLMDADSLVRPAYIDAAIGHLTSVLGDPAAARRVLVRLEWLPGDPLQRASEV